MKDIEIGSMCAVLHKNVITIWLRGGGVNRPFSPHMLSPHSKGTGNKWTTKSQYDVILQ